MNHLADTSFSFQQLRNWHLGPIASLRGYDFSLNPALSMILDAFITGLESDVLNSEMFHQSIDHLDW
ncbi:hypothetical protein ARMGADRAFT_1021507 [Armillaria gallica]|uniref:Uncharacterized protein n=1 Tax=Armillaria gallica TaxID=47427 RepID=A0A2H3CC66_ARMGA|nr:hypothetical protein ARMGADRAFT_1021507 [Armillaria gallica]